MKKTILSALALILISFSVILVSCDPGPKTDENSAVPDTTAVKSAAADSAMYVCPMHPEEKSSTPAKCSKCGMDLEKK